MPPGLLVTGPVPAPDLKTVSSLFGVPAVKTAVTLRACVMLTVQAPVPVQAPDQPAKNDPPAAAGVSVTDVPDE